MLTMITIVDKRLIPSETITLKTSNIFFGVVEQLVSSTRCQREGRGFESRLSRPEE